MGKVDKDRELPSVQDRVVEAMDRVVDWEVQVLDKLLGSGQNFARAQAKHPPRPAAQTNNPVAK
jgi:hypothetical protein